MVSVDIDAIPPVKINKSLDPIFSSIEERKLICYCDGSYSHYMQIGYSGFLASNGTYRDQFFSPRDPRCGSTDTEVLAAFLAIQYALEKHYHTLVIYTDNSKVEQLLKRPRENDYMNYPNICQIFNQYKKQKGNTAIQVIRVRGHTSICEQQKCKIKYQFAKIDRSVRRKTRQYIRKWWIRFEQNYYHWYKPDYHSYHTWKVLKYYA
jgi:ribonuclease HI